MPVFTHGKATKVFGNGVDISGFFKEYNFANKTDLADVSVFGDTIKKFVTGMEDSTLGLTGYFSGAAGEIDSILSSAIGSLANTVVTVSPNGNLAAGSRLLAGQAIEADYSIIGGLASVVEVNASFQSSGTIQPGVSLKPPEAETGSQNQTSVDQAVPSSRGGLMVLHVLANTMNGNSIIRVQHSADGITFVDLASVTVTPGQTGGFVATVPIDTTINQHIRASSTYAGTGSFTPTVAFVRL